MRINSPLRAFACLATAAAIGGTLALGTASGATAAPALSTPAVESATAAMIAAEAAGSAHASQPAATATNQGFTHACPAAAGHQSCLALKRNRVQASASSPTAIPSGVGYGPAQLQSAYNLASASASNGAGRTIALVDAYDDANAASDLAAYRAAAGLPAATFTKVNQNGQTSPLPSAPPSGDDWTLEESLDLDMASAICPLCKIVLVEADDDSGNGLFIAQNTAAKMAGYISDSWGGSESATESAQDSSYFTHASGIVTTVSAGDSDYGVSYPATSPKVVSVGGTTLTTASNSRGWTESVWNTTPGSEGAGSGCSAYEPKPSWQSALSLPSGCSHRIDNDVAADADPATGVAVYDTANGNTGWNEVGGTSASSPMVAAMFALAGNAGANPAQGIYQHTSNFYDITSGNDGSCSPAYLCTAETGYDGPTGIGTPNGIAGVQAASTSSTSSTSGGSSGNSSTSGGNSADSGSSSASNSGSAGTQTGSDSGIGSSSAGMQTGSASGTASVTDPGNQTSTRQTSTHHTAISTLQILATHSAGMWLTYSATGPSISRSRALIDILTGARTATVTAASHRSHLNAN